MNIGKFFKVFRFLRRNNKNDKPSAQSSSTTTVERQENDKPLNWYRGEFLDNPSAQGGNTTIVEYQDQWTKTPTQMPIRSNNGSGQRQGNNPRL